MRDASNSYLTAEGVDADPDSPMKQLLESYITYRIAVGRKARLAGNGLVLDQRRNTANDRFTARPKGATQILQYGVAALEKDMPFSNVL